jgi:site-specific DNA-adenine methylase
LKRLVGQRVELQRLEQLERLQRLEKLQQLERLQRLEKLHFTNKDYKDVLIHNNSVIYCDIPYFGTGDYGSTFSHKEFFDWADSQSNPVFISEYNINDKRFTVIKEFAHRTTFSPSENNSVVEKLYGNKAAIDILNSFRKEKQNG